MWKKGQKLVCVDDTGQSPNKGPMIKKGEIYTFKNQYGTTHIHVVEIPETPSHDMVYHMVMFREVDESFGEWVEETIMKEVVYEEALTQK